MLDRCAPSFIASQNTLKESRLTHDEAHLLRYLDSSLTLRWFRFDQLSFLKRIVHSAHSKKKTLKRPLPDLVMNFLLEVITNVNFAVPMVVCVIAVWRVARLRGFTTENYQDRVLESVSDTLKEQISEELLGPLLQSNGIPLPPRKTSYDVIERMVEHDPNNVGLLGQIYSSLESLGIMSPYFQEAVDIALSLF